MSDLDITPAGISHFFALIIDMVVWLMFVTAIIFLIVAAVCIYQELFLLAIIESSFSILFLIIAFAIRKIKMIDFLKP